MATNRGVRTLARPRPRPRAGRWLLAAGLALGVVAASAVPAGAAATGAAAQGATHRYIVRLASAGGDVAAVARTQLDQARPGARPDRVFRHALRGYTARLTAGQALELAADPAVAAVELDRVVSIRTTQTNAPWGLDRIDQRALPLSGAYTYTRTGAGVRAYIIDTGIRLTHSDFGGRASSGFDAIDGGSADDCNGHGTHVASTVGGSAFGVAKGVSLVAVRVLDCNGSGALSGVISGVDWAVGNHGAGQPAVANMSLGGGASSSLDQAINRLINDGVTVAVAAGNSSADACSGSPSRVPAALTVAASDRNDALASFSNRGSCVDIIAPGVNITAAWLSSDTATNTISGTSMATPHAAGAAAKFLQANPSAAPASVVSALVQASTKGAVSGTAAPRCRPFRPCPAATPNQLLFTDL
jgi:subtilisin family serine protease